MKAMKQFGAVCCLAVLLAACGGNRKIESDLRVRGAPDWVSEGTQAVNNEEGRFIHGVGMAPEMGDLSLQRATADNRARTEIARVLSTYVNSTLNDYTSSTGYGAGVSVDRAIESTTQLSLAGARILGNWVDKRTGNMYAFAELDLKTLDRNVATANNLSKAFKDFYSRNADAHFERFVEEAR
jgi:hypothetical protein